MKQGDNAIGSVHLPVCLCSQGCNQGAYMDNSADVVDRLLYYIDLSKCKNEGVEERTCHKYKKISTSGWWLAFKTMCWYRAANGHSGGFYSLPQNNIPPLNWIFLHLFSVSNQNLFGVRYLEYLGGGAYSFKWRNIILRQTVNPPLSCGNDWGYNDWGYTNPISARSVNTMGPAEGGV